VAKGHGSIDNARPSAVLVLSAGQKLESEEHPVALPSLDDYFPDWKQREALAEAMIPIIGKLYRSNVVTYCYGRALYNQSVTSIMKAHRFVRQVERNELSEFETYPIFEAMAGLDLGPCHIDVGKLASQFMVESAETGIDAEAFVRKACAEVIGRHTPPIAEPQDVVLYGFGRIGRLAARLLIEKTGGGQQLRLRAIVVRPSKWKTTLRSERAFCAGIRSTAASTERSALTKRIRPSSPTAT